MKRSNPCPVCGTPTIWLVCSNECQAKREVKLKNMRYGHVTLRQCVQCKDRHTRNSKYCSNRCKQRAYRLRHDPRCGSWKRLRERANSAVRTKQATTRNLECNHCGKQTTVTVAEAINRKYCSDACRQAAYRLRKKSS